MRFAAFSKSTRLSSWIFLKFGKFLQILRHLQIADILLNFHENCCFFKPIFCENFEIAAVQKDANLVELEKCCRTHIFLQKFVLIQPRTSPPKICKICKQNANYANFANHKKHRRQPAVIKGDRQGRGRLTPAEGDWTDDITGGWYEEFESNVKEVWTGLFNWD